MTTFKDISTAMADVVASTNESLVTVDARRRQTATGIIWSEDGIIVTAHHVVERDENIHVHLPDGSRVSADLVGRDPHNDLALLRANASGLSPVTWGDNDSLRPGNLAVAVGKADGKTEASLGVIVSLVSGAEMHGGEKAKEKGKRKRRRRRRMRVLTDGYIQADMVMYPGFSGGPLISGGGEVHGMNTSGFSHQGGVTVPVSTIRSTIETLLAHGKMKQGYLGVGVQPVRLPEQVADEQDQETGLLVVSVEKESPAASAGILVGDILFALADDSLETMDDLMRALRGERVGTTVSLSLVRGGEVTEMTVSVGERE